MKRDKKNLVATDDGKELIMLIPDFMKSAKLTADWENALSLIAKGEKSATDFMEQIHKLTTDIISSADAALLYGKQTNSLNQRKKNLQRKSQQLS